jgi:hypothetical protein
MSLKCRYKNDGFFSRVLPDATAISLYRYGGPPHLVFAGIDMFRIGYFFVYNNHSFIENSGDSRIIPCVVLPRILFCGSFSDVLSVSDCVLTNSRTFTN